MSYPMTMLVVSLSGFLPFLPMMALFHVVLENKNREHAVKPALPHILAVYLLGYVLVCVLSVTSIPSVYHFSADMTINFVPFADLFTNFHQYLLNILLFVPTGFLLPLLWEKFQQKHMTFLWGFFLSLTIEILQLFNNRITDIDDLLMNTVGTVVGYFLFMWARKKFPKLSVFALNHGDRWKWEACFCFGFVWLSMLFFQPLVFNGLFGIKPVIIA